MSDEEKQGNEPTPIILVALSILPLVAMAVWFMLG
jgi:hypothetical protein